MSYKIKLNHLRAYQAIMMTGSITAAAERLHMTQPALSKLLASLEQVLGFRLFDRSSGGRLAATPLGLQFYRQVEGMLLGIEQLPGIAKDLLERGEGRLRVGATPPLMNSSMFSTALNSFFAQYPGHRISLESRPRQDIEEWVANGQIDLGLALLPVENPSIACIALVETAAVAVVSADHRLARRKTLSPALLADERLILPHGQLLRAAIDQASVAAGYSLQAAVEASSALTCCKLAAQGIGVGICDPFSATAFGKDGIVVKPWQPQVRLTYGAMLKRDREMGGTLRAFMACLRAASAQAEKQFG